MGESPIESKVRQALCETDEGYTVKELADRLGADSLAVADACIGLRQAGFADLRFSGHRGHFLVATEKARARGGR